MSKRDHLPSLGHAISYFEEGSMPPVKALVLFFESWYRLGRVPNKFDYELLYRALKEILPAVTEWPQEPVIYWAGKDLNGTPIHQAYVDSYDKFKEYLDAFGPLFDAHDFIMAYEDGKGAEYMNRAAKAKANREAVVQAKAENPKATQAQIAEQVGLSRSRVTEIVGEMSANEPPKLLKHGGKREKQVANSPLDKGFQASKKSSTSPERVKARLARDSETDPKAGTLLKEVESGQLSAHKAAIAMGWVKQPDVAKIVEKQREKLEPEEQVAIWQQWGRALPDEVIDRLEVAKDAYLNLSADEALTFMEWVNNQAWSSAA